MSSFARIEELEKKYAESPRRFFAPLANEFRKSGDTDRAIELCRAHLEQQPNHMSGQVVLGQALFDAGQREESRAAFELALSLDPENLIALRHLGDMALEGGDFLAARARYKQVLDVDSRNHEVIAVLRELEEMMSAQSIDSPASGLVAGSGEWGTQGDNMVAAKAAADAEASAAAAVSVSNRWSEPAKVDEESVPPAVGEATPTGGEPTQEPVAMSIHSEGALTEAGEEAVAMPTLESSAAEVDSAALPAMGFEEPTVAATAPNMDDEDFWSVEEEPADEVREDFATSLDSSVAVHTPDTDAGNAAMLSIVEEGELPRGANSPDQSVSFAIPGESVVEAVAPGSAVEAVSPESVAEPLVPESAIASPEPGGVFESRELEPSFDSLPAEPVDSMEIEKAAEMPPDMMPRVASGSLEDDEDDEADWDDEVDDALSWEMQLLSDEHRRDGSDEDGGGWTPVDPAAAETAEFSDEEEADLEWPQAAASESVYDEATDMSGMDIVEEQPAPPPAPAVFITETMAQLYEQQGYLEMAAAVYRQLLDRDPTNNRLQASLASLDGRLSGRGDRPAERRNAAIEEGDSARDFFSALVQVPLRPRLARPYTAERPATPQGGSPSSITEAGSPAREASNALSLDSVFKNGAARPGVATSSGFSFDNFFSGNTASSPTQQQKERAPRAARRRRGEDAHEIEQFNSWLEGLKRS